MYQPNPAGQVRWGPRRGAKSPLADRHVPVMPIDRGLPVPFAIRPFAHRCLVRRYCPGGSGILHPDLPHVRRGNPPQGRGSSPRPVPLRPLRRHRRALRVPFPSRPILGAPEHARDPVMKSLSSLQIPWYQSISTSDVKNVNFGRKMAFHGAGNLCRYPPCTRVKFLTQQILSSVYK